VAFAVQLAVSLHAASDQLKIQVNAGDNVLTGLSMARMLALVLAKHLGLPTALSATIAFYSNILTLTRPMTKLLAKV